MKGIRLIKVPQRKIPILALGERDVMKEVRRIYGVGDDGLKLNRISSRHHSKYKYRF